MVLLYIQMNRTGVLAEMMRGNNITHTIPFSKEERGEQIYAVVILPHLETNLYRPGLLAIKKVAIQIRR